MKQLIFATALTVAALASAQPTITWETLGNECDADGNWSYVQRFTIVPEGPFSRMAFNQFHRVMDVDNAADTLIELVPGYYAVASPRFEQAKAGEPIVVDIRTKAALRSINYAADGAHLVDLDGKPVAAKFSRENMLTTPDRWAAAGRDLMPYGPEVYARNEAITGSNRPEVYDVIPSYKSVVLTGGTSVLPEKIEFEEIDDPRQDFSRIIVKDGRVILQTSAKNRAQAERRFVRNTRGRGFAEAPNAVLEQWADMEYRGLMIDVARNFLSPAELDRVIELMADYGLNTLHFHFADDEAWRLEIPSLPELVEVGGRRGYTTDESDFIMQIFTGNGNPDDLSNSSNGYFSRAEFIHMLRHADSLGIRVLPEIESPGHGRAAIRAMQKRARNTGNASWLLFDPADTSRYTSAQSFHDNAMNPAMPGPYKLMETVARDLRDMYAEAGLTLEAVHIGGDEVPRGAWDGSPIAQAYMQSKGYTTQRELHEEFVRRVSKMFKEMGIKISGWQEMGVGHPEEYNREIAENTFSLNCWSTLPSHGHSSVTVDAVKAGFPIILSNVDHNYFDLSYSNHPLETGLSWGGTVDEFASLSAYRDSLCNAPADAPGYIRGISAQVFGETLRSDRQFERYILPKMTGLSERSWHATPTYTEPEFQSLIAYSEMPLWEAAGYNYHLRQPGIDVKDGLVVMNNPYDASVEIRYTTDGTLPTADSSLYSGPFDPAGAKRINAILVFADKQSVPTILDL